mgnify:CR=1 FL=1
MARKNAKGKITSRNSGIRYSMSKSRMSGAFSPAIASARYWMKRPVSTTKSRTEVTTAAVCRICLDKYLKTITVVPANREMIFYRMIGRD